jgi:hypothetical protein
VSAYAKGDRVRFLGFGEADPYSQLCVGTEGTVATVDDLGTVHVDWDDGSRLGMVVAPPPGRPPDRIERIADSAENRPSSSE